MGGRQRLAVAQLLTDVTAERLQRFRTAHPGIALIVTEGGSADLIAGLLDHRLDLALIVAPDTGVDPELTAAPLLRENLVVASAVAGPPPIEDGSMARFRGERTSLGASGARGGNFSVTSRARGVASEGL